jgi:hypothetical protein
MFMCGLALAAAKPAVSQLRFGHHDAHHDAKPKFVLNADGVVIPEIVDTLEWVLELPVNVHQFDEPPVRRSTFETAAILQRLTLLLFFLDCC